MDAAKLELESYEQQIKELDESLRLDPSSTELQELKTELETLVELLRKSLQPAASTSASRAPNAGASTSANPYTSSSSSKAAANFTTGAEILAKWRKDGKFYPARIASVSGSTSDPVYTVIFDVDKSTEVVRKGDVKALTESKKRSYQTHVGDGDEGGSGKEGGDKKLKKGEKKQVKEEERKARVAQQNATQSSWQNFAKKGAKKGLAGMTGESQFRSPDNPYGRVGVVGSGKGMTQYEQKKRAKFEETGEEQ